MNTRSIALLAAALFTASAIAEPVTGIVTNKTNNKPSGGDTVTLLKLSQGMQDMSSTKTDSKGHFTLDVPADGLHMIRVTHDGANYFRPVQPGTQSVEVEVYNAAAKVAGVSEEADVMRIESDPSGSGLRVVEHYFIKNASTPPMTQFSDKPFELFLPTGAVVEGSAAMAPGGMAVQQPLVPLSEPGHYSIIFPLRPGETQFQVTYKLPYSGTLILAPHPSLTTDTIAIMLPKSMTFKAGPQSTYSAVTEETSAQTYVARAVSPSQPLSFTISGTGALPRDAGAGAAEGGPDPGAAPAAGQAAGTAANGSPTPAEASAAMRNDTAAGKGLGNPLDSQGDLEPWAKYKWWIIGGLALVLATGAGILLRGPSETAFEATSPAADHLAATNRRAATPANLLSVLKEELFLIETEKLQGSITEPEYTELKSALETLMRRGLTRTAPAPAVTVVPE